MTAAAAATVDRAGSSSGSVGLVGPGLLGGIEMGSLVVAGEGVDIVVGRLGKMGVSSSEVVGADFVVGLDTVIVAVVDLASSDCDLGLDLDLDLVVAMIVRSRPYSVEAVDAAAAANSDYDPADSVQVHIQAVVLGLVHDDQQQVHKHYEHST